MIPIDLISAVAGGVVGGATSLIGREAIRVYRRPRLSLDLYEAKGARPYIVTRSIDETSLNKGGQKILEQKMAKDIHLIVENKGYRAVQGCEATMDVFEEDEEIPKSIRLGWRKRPPVLYQDLDSESEAMRQRTAPFVINRKSEAQLDLLRCRYAITRDAKTREKLDEKVEKLTTLSSFRSHDFENDTEYRLEVTVTSSNADPEDITLRLNWDGQIDDESLEDAIRKK